MDYTNDATMLRKVTELMDKLEKNGQMQQLAYENGIDTKNSVKLTAATKENIAVSVIALMLAKQDNDPRYRDLVRYGMDHRQTKAGIINDYKNQANALITKYRNGERPETIEVVKIETEQWIDGMDESEFMESVMDMSAKLDVMQFIQEGTGGAVAAGIGVGVGALLVFIITLPIMIIVWVCKLIVSLFQAIIGIFKKTTPEKLIAKLEKLSPEDKEMFLLNTKGIDIPKLLILMPIQKLIDDWTELANNSDIAQRKSWEDFENKIKNIVAMSKRNENFSWLQNNVRNYAENVQLNYQATIDVLNMLKNIDVNKLRDLVKKYNKIIAEKTRELKQLENEHKNDNTPSTAEQRRNAEYIQKVSNDFVNLVRDTYNTAMTIMRTTSTTIYNHFGDDPHDGWYQIDSPNISKTKGLNPYAKAGFDMLHSI